MQIPSGQAGPTPAFFQALQGTPRPPAENGSQDAAKPVARGNDTRAVEAANRGSEPATQAQSRDIPRGSVVDIKA